MKKNKMKIDIQSPGFIINGELKGFINAKVEKLFRYCVESFSCKVVLRLNNLDTKENKLCEIRFAKPGNDLMANSQCKTFQRVV